MSAELACWGLTGGPPGILLLDGRAVVLCACVFVCVNTGFFLSVLFNVVFFNVFLLSHLSFFLTLRFLLSLSPPPFPFYHALLVISFLHPFLVAFTCCSSFPLPSSFGTFILIFYLSQCNSFFFSFILDFHPFLLSFFPSLYPLPLPSIVLYSVSSPSLYVSHRVPILA